MLGSALARPQSPVFGEDAYPSLHEKAAALMYSLTRGHPLVGGRKRLALASTIAILGLNGRRLALSEGEAYDLTVAAASGEMDSVDAVAQSLRTAPMHS